MFKADRSRAPLKHTRPDVVTVDQDAEMQTQRWDNEGGATASEPVPQSQLHQSAYHRAASDSTARAKLVGYVPGLLAQLKLRQE